MRVPSLLVVAILLVGCSSFTAVVDSTSDAPDVRVAGGGLMPRYATYSEALAAWRRPQDLNSWIGATFAYDMERAVALSESQRANKAGPKVFEPAAFYAKPVGVCVDLARFAVETLSHVAPELKARYLMIEFNPALIRGQVLRRHWVATYDTADGVMVIADSKRPGVLAGPYKTIEEFVNEYAAYRGREIVSYRETDSYGRKSKVQAKQRRGNALYVER